MARTDTLGNFLTDVATAIRDKKGTTDTIQASNFDTEIASIQSGGGDKELEASFLSIIDSSLGANCTKLPSGLTSLKDRAFAGCTNLALTSLPSEITSFGEFCFNGCTDLALTSLPSGITQIKTYCFNGCRNLALTSLPSGITYIGQYAFQNCAKLAITSLPSEITTIAGYAFVGCTNLALTSLPSGLTNISINLFEKCTNLITLNLHSGLTNINGNAFKESGLQKLIINKNDKAVTLSGSNAFTSTPIASGTGYIYVPDALVDSYKSATNWSTYATQIKPLSELEASE